MVILQNPVHPGEALKEEFMAELDLSAEALAKAVQVPPSRIKSLMRQETDMTRDMATRLSKYLGTSSAFWLNLQCNYDLGVVGH